MTEFDTQFPLIQIPKDKLKKMPDTIYGGIIYKGTMIKTPCDSDVYDKHNMEKFKWKDDLQFVVVKLKAITLDGINLMNGSELHVVVAVEEKNNVVAFRKYHTTTLEEANGKFITQPATIMIESTEALDRRRSYVTIRYMSLGLDGDACVSNDVRITPVSANMTKQRVPPMVPLQDQYSEKRQSGHEIIQKIENALINSEYSESLIRSLEATLDDHQFEMLIKVIQKKRFEKGFYSKIVDCVFNRKKTDTNITASPVTSNKETHSTAIPSPQQTAPTTTDAAQKSDSLPSYTDPHPRAEAHTYNIEPELNDPTFFSLTDICDFFN